MDSKLSSLPICLVLSILSFCDVYYKEGDFTNRNGKFVQKISENDPRKKIISEKLRPVVVTISYRSSRFIPFYYCERFIGTHWRLVVTEDREYDCIKIVFTRLSHLTCYGPSGTYYLR
jgi:hypothetical protein